MSNRRTWAVAAFLACAACTSAAFGDVGEVSSLIRQYFGAPVRASAPTDGQVLTFDSSSGTWRSEDPAVVAGEDELVVHTAATAVLPAAQPATTLAVGDHQVVVFGDAADSDVVFEGHGAFASPYTVHVTWAAATAAAGEVRWVVERELTEGQVIGTPGFGLLYTEEPTVSPAPGTITTTSTGVGATLNGAYRLRVKREPLDLSDTVVGDVYLLHVTIEQ